MIDPVAAYAAIRPKYEAFCRETKRIVEASFEAGGITFHTIEARAKDLDSFSRKAGKRGEGGAPKYTDPLAQITDLAAVRIITYTLSDVDVVSKFVADNFDVVERTDVGEKRFEEGKFGYQSIHFLVRLTAERANLPDVAHYAGLVCEIQVRTILQHAWAEIEHDIQYKTQSDLPASLQRKFTALAGLLEIADREFQSIRDLDESLKRTISESLQEDLTRVAIADTTSDAVDDGASSSVRQLIRQRRYDEAVRVYDTKIEYSPTMHTLYIGRAKVRFLSGDRAGAIADINEALRLNPDDPAIAILQQQVEIGPASVPEFKYRDKADIDRANDLTKMGNESLESGDGAAAFEHYSEAQESGASRPFSLMNKAMACVVAADFDGARIQLSSLEVRVGTPFSVCILSVYCVAYAFGAPDRFEEEVTRLKLVLMACDNFVLDLSPLPRLFRGIQRSPISQNGAAMARLDRITTVLQEASQP